MTGTIGRTAVVIGAGPAGLMAADVLSQAGIAVTVADRMPSVGRKFLMAGKSGLNLTKAEGAAQFRDAFGTASPALTQALADFGPAEVIAWAQSLDQPVFTGSTGRVFPVAMKASPLLRAWLARLASAGVTFNTRWTWTGWLDGALTFDTPNGTQRAAPDITILAVGGGSWRRLGSDGAWTSLLDDVAPFAPANCAFRVAWSTFMAPSLGQPVKATRLSAGALTSRGEWVLTREGIEGGGIYEVSSAIRDGAALTVDLMPDLSRDQITARITARGTKATIGQLLKSALRLPPVKVALFQEMTRAARLSVSPATLPHLLKALPIVHAGPAALDSAISTAGGLRFSALDGLMIRGRPGTFAAGEMLDWEAPTGGYLLTACLATGRAAALAALAHHQGGLQTR
ncbi:TIGR03862 family flavoprotein [Loktanella fryxellensis]|nr:TIGR03862 family flavoprotein [Loktanella fryxellensis]